MSKSYIDQIEAHMKKDAVMTSPKASMNTARVGYHASSTGLVIGFGAWKLERNVTDRKQKLRDLKETMSFLRRIATD